MGVRGQLFERHDQGWVADDAQIAVDAVGELREGPVAVLGLRLGDVARERLAGSLSDLRLPEPVEVGRLQPQVPDIEIGHRRKASHRLAVSANGRADRRSSLLLLQLKISGRHGEACDQPLQVPLPGPGQGLVEVVEVEDHVALGRPEAAEVREVGVPAELHGDAGRRGVLEVGSHHRGGTPVESERGDEHAPVAKWDELRHPCLRLSLKDLDRVTPVAGRLPVGVRGARRLTASGLSSLRPRRCGCVATEPAGASGSRHSRPQYPVPVFTFWRSDLWAPPFCSSVVHACAMSSARASTWARLRVSLTSARMIFTFSAFGGRV